MVMTGEINPHNGLLTSYPQTPSIEQGKAGVGDKNALFGTIEWGMFDLRWDYAFYPVTIPL